LMMDPLHPSDYISIQIHLDIGYIYIYIYDISEVGG
jgi:hypothetical protein